jgi:hypothetical protein
MRSPSRRSTCQRVDRSTRMRRLNS